MLRNFVIATVGVLVFAACSSKPKQPDANAAGVGGEQPVIDPNAEMSFDPSGSDSGKINGLGTIYFEYDQARLDDKARQQLSANAEWIKTNPKATIQIEGHTDERGSVEYNLSLGERRAKAVKQYLSSLGVEAQRMTIISYGEEKPIQSGDNETAYSKNRRANFLPLKQ